MYEGERERGRGEGGGGRKRSTEKEGTEENMFLAFFAALTKPASSRRRTQRRTEQEQLISLRFTGECHLLTGRCTSPPTPDKLHAGANKTTTVHGPFLRKSWLCWHGDQPQAVLLCYNPLLIESKQRQLQQQKGGKKTTTKRKEERQKCMLFFCGHIRT